MSVQPSLGPGSASPEIKPVKGRKARRGLYPGSKVGKGKKFCGSVCFSLEQLGHRQEDYSKGSVKTHGRTAWHQQWHTGTARGGCVGRS